MEPSSLIECWQLCVFLHSCGYFLCFSHTTSMGEVLEGEKNHILYILQAQKQTPSGVDSLPLLVQYYLIIHAFPSPILF